MRPPARRHIGFGGSHFRRRRRNVAGGQQGQVEIPFVRQSVHARAMRCQDRPRVRLHKSPREVQRSYLPRPQRNGRSTDGQAVSNPSGYDLAIVRRVKPPQSSVVGANGHRLGAMGVPHRKWTQHLPMADSPEQYKSPNKETRHGIPKIVSRSLARTRYLSACARSTSGPRRRATGGQPPRLGPSAGRLRGGERMRRRYGIWYGLSTPPSEVREGQLDLAFTAAMPSGGLNDTSGDTAIPPAHLRTRTLDRVAERCSVYQTCLCIPRNLAEASTRGPGVGHGHTERLRGIRIFDTAISPTTERGQVQTAGPRPTPVIDQGPLKRLW